MKPTQAHIEAAAKPEEFDHIRNMLTNYAARLQDKNEEPPGQFLLANAFLRAREMLDLLLLRLTAAAETGEHVYAQSQLDSVVKQTWSATIERCAQVAKEVLLNGNEDDDWTKARAERVFAAIRAMKDKL